jgi:hypothetical protein
MGLFSSIFGGSSSKQTSKPISASKLSRYFSELNSQAGGNLGSFAQQGTPAVPYRSLQPEQVSSLGGLGATQRTNLERQFDDALSRNRANPSLSLFQRQRADQLTTRDFVGQQRSLDEEIEAAIVALTQEERRREYQAAIANAQRRREDLSALSNIFYAPFGTESKSSGSKTGGIIPALGSLASFSF